MTIHDSSTAINFISCVLVLIAVIMTGCVTGQNIRALTPGMSQAQVISKLGKPDSFQVKGEYTALQYINRLISGWSWNTTDYHVILKNDKLVEYGSGEIRVREVGGPDYIYTPRCKSEWQYRS